MKISYWETLKRIEAVNIGEAYVLAGFDAVQDHLVNVVKHWNEQGDKTLFSTISEFGSYLCSKAGMSCCIELKTVTDKIGGNMVILAQALADLGVRTACVGTLGDEKSVVYNTLAQFSDVYSLAPYGSCTALEFKDGKVMLANNSAMYFTWRDVMDKIGEDTLSRLLERCNMLCLLNWAEMANANEIWRQLLDFAADRGVGEGKMAFIDLSDFSHRTTVEIILCAEIIKDYGKHFRLTLGLNENEARHFAKAFQLRTESIEGIGRELLGRTGVETLVIHTNTYAYAFDKDGAVFEGPAFICTNPRTLTGGGDNFNAGFCLGKLLNLGSDACVLLGNACSGYYVRNGKSTDFDSMKAFIKSYLCGKD